MAELVQQTPSIPTKITNDLAWARHHLFLMAVVLILAFAGIYGVESLLARRTAENDSKWQSILSAQTAQTQVISEKLSADEKTWQAQNAAQQQLIGQLAQTIAQRNTQVAQQVKTDASLSAQEAAQRLSQQTGAQPGQVTAQGNNLLVDLPISRGIVTSLDLLPVAQANLVDTQKQLAAQTTVSTNLQSDVTAQQVLVSALRTQNADQVKACQAQVADVKAKARKSKLKWFFAGLITGLIGGHAAGI